MNNTVTIILCCLVSLYAGHEAFTLAKDGFMNIGINPGSAENFARIIWGFITPITLTALFSLSTFIERK